MPHELLSADDVDFMVFDWLRADDLTARPPFSEHDKASLQASLDMSKRLAERYFAPHFAANDTNEPHIVDGRVTVIPEVQHALDQFAKAGLISAQLGSDFGGVNLPMVVHQACMAWFQTANLATAAYAMLSIANANLLVRHGDDAQINRFVVPLLEGRWYGTMCLTEPEVGSSLGDISTRAEPQPDGSYRLFGSKMWISGGDHELGENILHLVLARIAGAPAGVSGLSLFAVPKRIPSVNDDAGDEPNDITLVGLNHKMGYRGTVNTALNFGDGTYNPGGAPGAVGEIVGAPGRGLIIMFDMMNEARIGVGASAAGLAYSGYRTAVQYAKSRLQGRPLADAHASRSPVPIAKHPDVRRMLLASKSYAEGSLALVLYAARLCDVARSVSSDAEREQASLLLSVLTPIVKSWPAQWGLEANNLALQVHGGYGYSREYPVEQLYRDNRVNAIHEGTHGIQALDLLGRKLTMHNGAGLQLLGDTIQKTVDSAAASGLRHHADVLAAARDRMTSAVSSAWRDNKRDQALANASLFLEAAGHVVMAWLWLDQVMALRGPEDSNFARGKMAACRYFYDYELPKTVHWFEIVAGRNTLLLDMDDAWF